ncbi:phage terminase large subunit [Siccirubricoccus phaeus]|uniref:phage terminase large subunit n=1 Tax=Siccirubricoccus phaeus TaxID=2595053 RepID=UPI0011F26163
MRLHSPVRPILWRPQFDKAARLLTQAPKFQAGQVLLPRKAPWLAEHVAELLGFLDGAHDDQVDSTSQALSWLSRRIATGNPTAPPSPKRPAGAPRQTTRR